MKDNISESKEALKWAKKNLKRFTRMEESRGRTLSETDKALRLFERAQSNHDTICERYIDER